jgi:hypothetical protein
VESEWRLTLVDGSMVRMIISTSLDGVGWRLRIIAGWPAVEPSNGTLWRRISNAGLLWSCSFSRMSGTSVPAKLTAETTAARQYLNHLQVQPHGALCTVLLFHTQQNNWMDAGPGFCSLRGRQLAVRDKNVPSRYIMQQTIGDNTFYQQDGHSLLLFAVSSTSPDRHIKYLSLAKLMLFC